MAAERSQRRGRYRQRPEPTIRRHADDWGLPGAYLRAAGQANIHDTGCLALLAGVVVTVAVAWIGRLRDHLRPAARPNPGRTPTPRRHVRPR